MQRSKPTSLPDGLASPARRALEQAGIERLEDLAKFTEAELLDLHGMGPNAVAKLRAALADAGLALRDET